MLYPMELEPVYKDYLWGGRKLERLYGKRSGLPVTAESWELACHRDGKSRVANGEHAGAFLADVIPNGDRFPVLVKLIDAREDLSVQVHPSDETADRAAGEEGKAEMWYVIGSEPGGFLYLGFNRRMTREGFLAAAREGTICSCLNRVPVEKGDVFFIRPGTVHAIGGGVLIAEIQQSSNTTFRIYDYGRRGADGRPRALHLERAAAVADYEPIVPDECRACRQAGFGAFRLTELYSCDRFRTWLLDAETRAALCCPDAWAEHLLFVEGGGELLCGGERYVAAPGSSWYLPAGLGEYAVSGRCRALRTILPPGTDRQDA